MGYPGQPSQPQSEQTSVIATLPATTKRSRPLVLGDVRSATPSRPNRASRPLQPITRPPRSRPLPPQAPRTPHKPRWGRRIAILVICLVIALATAGLIVEGIVLTTGQFAL